MDEYSPRYYDIAELEFLCDELLHDGMQALKETKSYWLNDIISDSNLQVNELIEHIACVAWNFKIKYPEDKPLIDSIEEYIDESYAIFGSTKISSNELTEWQKMTDYLKQTLSNDGHYVH